MKTPRIFDAEDEWSEQLVALTSFGRARLDQDLWDELRDQCRELCEGEGGDDLWIACGLRDTLALLEAAGELHARR